MRASFWFPAVLLAGATNALAQVSDDWATRTTIAALPYHVLETQMHLATVESTDPDPPCRSANANPTTNTIWFGYTSGPTTEYVALRVTDFSILASIVVYTGTPGAFRIVSGACASPGNFPNNARLDGIRLAPNTSYSIEIGSQNTVSPGNTLDFIVVASPQYAVTKTADTADGTCDADCSLREAIGAANATPGAVLIPAGNYALTIPGEVENANLTGDLDVAAPMGIYGAGMTQTVIDAGDLDRVMHLRNSILQPRGIALGDFTLTGGRARSDSSGLRLGGGLYAALTSGGDFVGVERVAFISNEATESGGGMALTAPGTIRDSRFTGNLADFSGGGLYFHPSSLRMLDIDGSTFDDNVGLQFGGGLSVHGPTRVVNSTVSGNRTNFSGGGIEASGNSPLTLLSSTVVFNRAYIGNPNPPQSEGGIRLDAFNGTHVIANTVIAGNSTPAGGADCTRTSSAPIVSHHVHVQNSEGCTFTGTGDVTGTDPLMAPTLADNGGPNPTHRLDFASPAVDAGDPTGCRDALDNPLGFDQRGAGFPRVAGAACDKGAVETPPDALFANGFE